MARYDGIRYGLSTIKKQDTSNNNQTLLDVYQKSRARGFGAEAKRRIMLGSYVLSAGYYDAYYKKALKVRTLIKKEFEDKFDIIEKDGQNILFHTEVQGGTYIRKLVSDLGDFLGIGAHMLELRRVRAGIFKEDNKTIIPPVISIIILTDKSIKLLQNFLFFRYFFNTL